MFGLGIPELLIVGVVGLIVFFFSPGKFSVNSNLPPERSHFFNWVKLIVLCAVIETLIVTSGLYRFDIVPFISLSISSIVIYHFLAWTYLIFGWLTIVIWVFLAMPVRVLLNQLFYLGYFGIMDGVFETDRLEYLMDLDYLMNLIMAVPETAMMFLDLMDGFQTLEDLVFSRLWVIIITVVVVAAYKLIPKGPSDSSVHSLAISTQGYGGRDMKEFKTESTRFAAASAVLNGRLFRRKVLGKVESQHLAIPVELGLDYAILVSVCQYMAKRQILYDSLTFILALGVLISIAFQSPVTFVITIVLMIALHLYEQFNRYFQILPNFKKDRFKPETINRKFDLGGDEKLRKHIPSDDMNIVVYQGFLPFIGTGIELGGWSVGIDITRSSNDIGSSEEPIPFEITQLYETIDNGLMELGLDELELKDYVFINGSDIPKGSPILPNRFAAPNQILSSEILSEMNNSSQYHNRCYKWIKVRDWGDEIVVSFLLRCSLKGNTLFIELTRFLLTPVGDSYRKVDQLPIFTFATGFFWLVGALLKAPFLAVYSGLSFFGFMQDKVNDLFRLQERKMEKQIKIDPNFNYGAASSLREEMSSKAYLHYFQKIDKEMYEKMFDRQILDGIIDFLDAHHIDTAHLKERQSSILNTGIIVQKGDVNAQSLAVGEGAKAGLVDRFKKVKRTSVKQSPGGK